MIPICDEDNGGKKESLGVVRGGETEVEWKGASAIQRCGFATKAGGRETTLRALEERGENAPPHGHHLESVGPIEVPIAAHRSKHYALVTVSDDHFLSIK